MEPRHWNLSPSFWNLRYLHTARSAERKPPACGSLFGVSQGPSQPTAATSLLAAALVVREFQREWVVKVNLQGICEKYSIVRSKNHHDLDNKKPCANSFPPQPIMEPD